MLQFTGQRKISSFLIENSMKTISVLGNNSGRNAGDAAILGNLLRDISALYDDVLFTVPTTHPGFVKSTFKQFNVKPVPLLPWYGSIKNFGLPCMVNVNQRPCANLRQHTV